jgi:KaiC/GvpD/RAD55 family RecA-like ATPase
VIDRSAWHSELQRLELGLVATWVQGPRFRARWTPKPSEFSAAPAQALATACAALASRLEVAGTGADLGVPLMAELHASGALRRHWAAERSPLPVAPFQDPDAKLVEWRRLRTMFALATMTQEWLLGVTPGADPQAAMSGLLRAIEACYVNGPLKGYSKADLIGRAILSATQGSGVGSFSGLPDLDRITGGIKRGHVWAIGAPTNWGKTSLLLAILDHTIEVHGAKALLVTCEDDPDMIGDRWLARNAGIDGMAIRDKKLRGAEFDKANDVLCAARALGPNAVVLDGRGQTVEAIANSVRSHVAAHGVQLVLVDYLQCIKTERATDDRRGEINHIARTLTDAIKVSGAAGVLASQLTGEDLRESRDVEHAAEVVLIGKRNEETKAMTLWVKKNKTGPAHGEIEVELDPVTGALYQRRDADHPMREDLWNAIESSYP